MRRQGSDRERRRRESFCLIGLLTWLLNDVVAGKGADRIEKLPSKMPRVGVHLQCLSGVQSGIVVLALHHGSLHPIIQHVIYAPGFSAMVAEAISSSRRPS